jgi:hypothetical protein
VKVEQAFVVFSSWESKSKWQVNALFLSLLLRALYTSQLNDDDDNDEPASMTKIQKKKKSRKRKEQTLSP